MKFSLLVSILLIFMLGVAASFSNFCDGFEKGYCEGWKYVKGQYANCPVTPPCPIAEPGLDTYKDGYNRGFTSGIKAAKKEN